MLLWTEDRSIEIYIDRYRYIYRSISIYIYIFYLLIKMLYLGMNGVLLQLTLPETRKL